MMRKILISLLATTICLGCFSVIFAKDFREDTIDTLLVPYIEVLKKLNADIGINLFIPDDRKESVYEYYKGYSPEEFEESILNGLNCTGNDVYDDLNSNTGITVESFPAYACNNKTSSIDEDSRRDTIDALLAPYIAVLDKVNAQTGAKLCIPDERKEDVYRYYKDYTLEEFEKSLIDGLNNTGDGNAFDVSGSMGRLSIEIPVSCDPNVNQGAEPNSVTENIEQKSYISYDSRLHVYSTVVGSGSPLTYRYKRINKIDVTWSTSNPNSFHFHMTSCSYSFSNNNKTCTVTVNGSPANAGGIVNSTQITLTRIFNAN